jgi:inhibitor of KinA sporulation pathway (predicted exonuclease)
MARRLDQALIIDVESTCWENRPPPGEVSEIIEIGLARVDLGTLERIDKRAILVRPQQSKVSPFCTELTSLTQEEVDSGVMLTEALNVLRTEYDSENRIFVSWGDYDRNQFHRNCQDFGLRYPFGPTHLNIKTLFSIANGIKQELGLDEAMKRLGLKLEGRHHRGVDDAWNIAQVFCSVMRRLRRGGG